MARPVSPAADRWARRFGRYLPFKGWLNLCYVDRGGGPEDSLIVAGSERSGTTWLADLINHRRDHRLLFEPFWPRRVEMARPFSPQSYLRPSDDDPVRLAVAGAILSGRIADPWVDRHHRGFFPRRRIIKDVRINLLLGWFRSQFPETPVVLILRHPLAVVSSQLRRAHWRPSLAEEFLQQAELVEDHLRPFVNLFRRDLDRFEELVLRWCVQSYVPLSSDLPGLHIVHYEHLCTSPQQELARLFEVLGIRPTRQLDKMSRRPSPTAQRWSAVRRGEPPIDAWTKSIEPEQVRRAIRLLEAFGLDAIYSDCTLPKGSQLKVVPLP